MTRNQKTVLGIATRAWTGRVTVAARSGYGDSETSMAQWEAETEDLVGEGYGAARPDREIVRVMRKEIGGGLYRLYVIRHGNGYSTAERLRGTFNEAGRAMFKQGFFLLMD